MLLTDTAATDQRLTPARVHTHHTKKLLPLGVFLEARAQDGAEGQKKGQL